MRFYDIICGKAVLCVSGGFFAMMFRMKYINRWGLMRSLRQENLAEHSLEVAILSHAIAELGNKLFGKNYDSDRIAVKALYHDAPEILTGDQPTPVKYHSAETKAAYDSVESAATERFSELLPQPLRSGYLSLFECTPEEKAVIKAADTLCAYIKCVEETSSGNGEFSCARLSSLEKLNLITLPEVRYFIDNYLEYFTLPLDEIK